MIKFLILVPLILLVHFTLAQQMNNDEFIQFEKSIQTELDRLYQAAQQNDENFPGATLAIALPNNRIIALATGFANYEQKLKMSPDSRMPVGSIGKTFAATLIMVFVEKGLIDLDQKISSYLDDEAWFKRLPNHSDITVRYLLKHSSGIEDHVFLEDSGFKEYAKRQFSVDQDALVFDPLDLIEFVLDRKPLFTAGEGFHYGDTGYILLGLILEKRSASTYYHELNQKIIKPHKLSKTTEQNQLNFPELAQGYAIIGHQLFGLPKRTTKNGILVFNPEIEWTGGGLVSNPQDLVRFAQLLFNGKIVSMNAVKSMLSSVATKEKGRDDFGREYGYGLGINIVKTDFGTAYRHGGFFPGYNSILAYYPDQDIAVALQINTDDSKIEEYFNAISKKIMQHNFNIGRAK